MITFSWTKVQLELWRFLYIMLENEVHSQKLSKLQACLGSKLTFGGGGGVYPLLEQHRLRYVQSKNNFSIKIFLKKKRHLILIWMRRYTRIY